MGESQAIERSMQYQQTVRWLKEFDTEYELMFNEPGPFYDKQGNVKMENGLAVVDILPYVIRMVTETARRQK